jgi:hypothetical protein
MGKTYRQLFRFTVDHVQAKVTNFRRPFLSNDVVESYEALSRPSKNKLIKEFIEFGLVDDMSRRGFEREFVSELVDELVADPQGIKECEGLGGRLSSDMVYSHFSGKGISKSVAVRVTKEVRDRLEGKE